MKALVKEDPRKGIRFREVETPHMGKRDVLLAVSAAGICGSDVSAFLWKKAYRDLSLPLILGHEFTGRVSNTGAEVTGIQEGDRVTVNPLIPCGECLSCLKGDTTGCEQRAVVGLTRNGCFAEYVSIPDRAAFFHLPDGISDEIGALIEPLCVAYHAIEISTFQPGESAAILGMGPIGLLFTALLRRFGAGHILTVGRNLANQRVKIALEMGADRVVDINSESLREAAIGLTGRDCFDKVFEATGNPSAVVSGLEILRKEGEMVLCGIFDGKGEIDLTELVRSRKRLVGSHTYNDKTWTKVIALLAAGSLPVEKLISEVIPLSDGLHAFEKVSRREGIKVLLKP